MTRTKNDEISVNEHSLEALESTTGRIATLKGFLRAVADGAAAGASAGLTTGSPGATVVGAAAGGAAGGFAYLTREG